MGWAYGTNAEGREVGYGIAAICDEDGCDEHIDRGVAYVCGGEHDGGEHGCGRYFYPGPLPEGEPVLVDCEGSGERAVRGLCPVCGAPVALGDLVIGHQRDDSVARLERGDYDRIIGD